MTTQSLNRVVLITGAGRGIGRQIAARLAAAGYRLGLTSRTAAELSATERLVAGAGGEAVALAGDVADPAHAERVCTVVEETFGPVGVLVSAAGQVGTREPFARTDLGTWWQVIETNLRGPALLTRRVLPSMIGRGSGHIINLNSRSAFGVNPAVPASAYHVSKAALMRLSDVLATELAGTGVVMIDLSPGLVRTAMTSDRPDLDQIPDDAWTPPSAAAEKVEALISGQYDMLHGHFVHVSDDLDALAARLARHPQGRKLGLIAAGSDDPQARPDGII